MTVSGTEANTLLTAQLAAQQRDLLQDAATTRRQQTTQIDEVTRRRTVEEPQTGSAVAAADTENTGNPEPSRPDLPRDAQEDARRATERNDGRAPSRGSVVSVFV